MEEPPVGGGPTNPLLAENVRQLMKERGIGGIGMLRDHMKAAGLSIGTSTLHRALQGQVGNRLESLDKIAQFFDVTTDQLLQPELGRGGEPSAAHEALASYGLTPILAWEHSDDLPPGEYVLIPRLDLQLSAGNGKEHSDHDLFDKQPQAFRADWIRSERLKPAKLACMTAHGSSMEPSVFDGDSLVLDTSQREVVDGRVYALWYEGGERVKRLFRLPGGGLRIKSDNPEFETIDLGPEYLGHVRIIGRVVHRSGKGGL